MEVLVSLVLLEHFPTVQEPISVFLVLVVRLLQLDQAFVHYAISDSTVMTTLVVVFLVQMAKLPLKKALASVVRVMLALKRTLPKPLVSPVNLDTILPMQVIVKNVLLDNFLPKPEQVDAKIAAVVMKEQQEQEELHVPSV